MTYLSLLDVHVMHFPCDKFVRTEFGQLQAGPAGITHREVAYKVGLTQNSKVKEYARQAFLNNGSEIKFPKLEN